MSDNFFKTAEKVLGWMDSEGPLTTVPGAPAPADARPAAETPTCVFGVFCRRHGFIHGAEAEELRQRVETILDQVDHEGDDAGEELDRALRIMLDEVDARDSLAWIEAKDATSESRDESADAVDPSAPSTGTPSTRVKDSLSVSDRVRAEQAEARLARLVEGLEQLEQQWRNQADGVVAAPLHGLSKWAAIEMCADQLAEVLALIAAAKQEPT